MKVYRVTAPEAVMERPGDPTAALAPVIYVGTLAEAHQAAKKVPKPWWKDLFVDELDIFTDKASIVQLLNGSVPNGSDDAHKTNRSWTLTARGGLTEDRGGSAVMPK